MAAIGKRACQRPRDGSAKRPPIWNRVPRAVVAGGGRLRAVAGGDGRLRAGTGGDGRGRAGTGGDGRRRAATGGEKQRLLAVTFSWWAAWACSVKSAAPEVNESPIGSE